MFYFSFNFFLVVLFVQVVVEYFLWSPKTPDASLAAAPAIKVRREWGKGDNEIQLIDSNRSYSEVSQVSSQSTKPDSPTHFYHYHALSFFKKTNLWVSYQGTAYLTQNMPKPRSAGTQTQRLCWQSTWPRASKCMGDHGFIWIHMDSYGFFPKQLWVRKPFWNWYELSMRPRSSRFPPCKMQICCHQKRHNSLAMTCPSIRERIH